MDERDKDWLRYAFSVASMFSQDANSETGAVIVDPIKDIQISFGANDLR